MNTPIRCKEAVALRAGLDAILSDDSLTAGELRRDLRALLDAVQPGGGLDLDPNDSAKLTGIWLDCALAHAGYQASYDPAARDWIDLYTSRLEFLSRLGVPKVLESKP